MFENPCDTWAPPFFLLLSPFSSSCLNMLMCTWIPKVIELVKIGPSAFMEHKAYLFWKNFFVCFKWKNNIPCQSNNISSKDLQLFPYILNSANNIKKMEEENQRTLKKTIDDKVNAYSQHTKMQGKGGNILQLSASITIDTSISGIWEILNEHFMIRNSYLSPAKV